jgi:hypothetical protein
MGRTSRRVATAVALAGLAAVAGVSVAVAGLGGGARDRAPAGGQASSLRQLAGVNFVSVCGFSHRNHDDLIVYPRQPGLSHDHTYVANRTTNAFSTPSSLLQGGTTCLRPADTAAYWMPTLLVDGQEVAPLGATIYYRRSTLQPVTAFPAGLKMIAGNSKAATPQPLRVTFWNCGVQAGIPPSSTPPACPGGRATSLRLHVNFGSCWDGASLDSEDHQSHVTYPVRGRCPVTHPVSVPAISLIYRYPVSGSHSFGLASGSVYSAHADFVNAWRQAALSRLVDDCLNALRHCGRGA